MNNSYLVTSESVAQGDPGAALPQAFADLIANASIEIAPRECSEIAAVADALPANACIYVPAPARRPLAETLAAVAAIRRAGLDPVPHIAARRFASRAELRDFLAAAVNEHGAHRVLLIAGDEASPRGPYADAAQVLEDGVLGEIGIREVGLSGYPEGHGRIAGAALEAAFTEKLTLARAQTLGVYVVTQFSFSTTRITAYCAELARREPELPVYVGMAGPSDLGKLMRYAQICGVSASLRAMHNLGASMVGLATHTDPHQQLLALAHYSQARSACNVVGIHLYSFGGAVNTAHWLRERLHRC